MTRQQLQALVRLGRSEDWPTIKAILGDAKDEATLQLANQHDMHALAKAQGVYQMLEWFMESVEEAPKKVQYTPDTR